MNIYKKINIDNIKNVLHIDPIETKNYNFKKIMVSQNIFPEAPIIRNSPNFNNYYGIPNDIHNKTYLKSTMNNDLYNYDDFYGIPKLHNKKMMEADVLLQYNLKGKSEADIRRLNLETDNGVNNDLNVRHRNDLTEISITEIKADDNDYETNLKLVLNAYDEKITEFGINPMDIKIKNNHIKNLNNKRMIKTVVNRAFDEIINKKVNKLDESFNYSYDKTTHN